MPEITKTNPSKIGKTVFPKKEKNYKRFFFQIWYEKDPVQKKVPVIRITDSEPEKVKGAYSSSLKATSKESATAKVLRIARKRLKSELGMHPDRSGIKYRFA